MVLCGMGRDDGKRTGFGGQGFTNAGGAGEEHDHTHTWGVLALHREAIKALEVPLPWMTSSNASRLAL